MAEVRRVEPVILVCGMIAVDEDVLSRAEAALVELYGPIEARSPVYAFSFTDYYRAEMGDNLVRRFVTFTLRVDPGCLAQVKQQTNALEQRFAAAAREEEGAATVRPRRINLDPGYVTPAKLVLATTKDFSHRIYLGGGIYAEVTLNFCRSGIRCHAWTYPDFTSGLYTPFLLEVRQAACEHANTRAQGT